MQNNPLILYHFPCAANDGFAAAYAAWCKYGSAAEYVPARPGTPPDCAYVGRDVFLVDLSYSVAQLDAIRAVAKSLTILDHHKDAEAVLRNYPGATFDLARSGATIAWAHFHPGTPVPQLLRHIEDRDLYVFQLPDTQDVLALVDTLPYEFSAWHEVASADEAQCRAYTQAGRAMRKSRVHTAGLVSQTHIEQEFMGAPAKIVNAPYALVNDVADHLLANYAGVAVIWCVEGDMLRISLRANKWTINVQQLIARLGGGGHDSAAAVRVPLNTSTKLAPTGKKLIAMHLTKTPVKRWGMPQTSRWKTSALILGMMAAAVGANYFANWVSSSTQQHIDAMASMVKERQCVVAATSGRVTTLYRCDKPVANTFVDPKVLEADADAEARKKKP